MSVPPTPVAVVNHSTVVTATDLAQTVAALQIQVSTHFKPRWGRGCKLTITSTPAAAAWVLGIFDDSDQAGALGYHDVTATNMPLGKVFARTDQKYGYDWHVTASHELLEMLADPWVSTAVQVGSSTFYALEVGDACEADQYGYAVSLPDGSAVRLSDFVLPNWFTVGAPGPYDHAGHVSKPLQLLSGGYIGEYICGQGWSQKTAETGKAPESRRLELRRRRHST